MELVQKKSRKILTFREIATMRQLSCLLDMGWHGQDHQLLRMLKLLRNQFTSTKLYPEVKCMSTSFSYFFKEDILLDITATNGLKFSMLMLLILPRKGIFNKRFTKFKDKYSF
jgi:hypothetical protein